MNEHLTERISRGSALKPSNVASSISRPRMVLNQSIREYFKILDRPADLSNWTRCQDIPLRREVFDPQNASEAVEVSANIVVGPYESKDHYLELHYSLLREDAVAPLRNVVSEVQAYPFLEEKESQESAYLYEKVCVNISSSSHLLTSWRFSSLG